MKYKFEPRYHTEEGFWYAERVVEMSLPDDDKLEFETEEECQKKCDELNEASALHLKG